MNDKFKMVPVEPTDEMVEAADIAARFGGCDLYGLRREMRNGYAAPVPPQGDAQPVAWLYKPWTESQVLDFISCALRHAEWSGLATSDINDGLRYMAGKGQPAFVCPDAGEVEQQRRLKLILAERVENAEANCSVYRHQIAERDVLLREAKRQLGVYGALNKKGIENRQVLIARIEAAMTERKQPVKLPERKSSVDVFSTYALGEVSGWNKCLDALGGAFGGE